MKTKKIISGLIIIVMLLLLMPMNVFAVDIQGVVLADVPYDVITFSEDLEPLYLVDQKNRFSITKDDAENLTTEALLNEILSNPFIVDFLAYDDFVQAINSKDSQFQIKELLGRFDINSVLNKYISIYSNSVIIYENTLGSNISLKSESIKLTSSEIENAFNVVKYEFLIKLFKTNLLLQSNTLIESKYTSSYVYTHNYIKVPCYLDYTWGDHDTTESSARASSALYYTLYPSAGEVAGEDPTYNCHSFAWHAPTTNNSVWIPSASIYISESTRVYAGNIRVGDKVCYYDSTGKCEHSGYVYEVNSNGTVKKVISKWGYLDLMLHPLTHCPYTVNNIRYYRY